MTNKEKGLEKVRELVARFKDQLSIYKKSDYNETQTRRDFIDPFFKALGWDMDNSQGLLESYREVIHEAKVKIGKAQKNPDYLFRLSGGKNLFFVEAKKPSVSIKDDIHPAFQLRRYGWSAKLDISILTDFEEFAIYDCTKMPNADDKSSVLRLKYLTFNEYEKEWDFLWDTFSQQAAATGSIERYFIKNADKKGTITVDKAFLISLDNWRTLLAENVSKENKQLDEDELNFVVQHTLDRIIFLRICEDRGIETYGSLEDCLKNGNYYKNILEEFKDADDKYNSGLFDFKKDKISQKVLINNATVKTIIEQLYSPLSPYAFAVLSVEILGSAYEQFLGKTITINDKGKAIIELKPEVRKSGGVYYTPQYIVDYIVANTIGNLIKNKTPKEVEEITIVDPACGSGSFLLGAYQYLLTWHKDYYLKNPKKNTITPDGNLTTGEKKKILLNNIFGVDIDFNAVEVTKLSLLLKCMEGETYASIENQKTMFNERVLPTLEGNIKSGNSLIDTDYYENQLEFGEERKVKPFSWKKNFPTVFKNGGFDVVIGNPPYVNVENLGESVRKYLFTNYKTCIGRTDLYVAFIEKNLKNTKQNSIISFIIPFAFTNQNYGAPLRKMLCEKYCVTEIVDTSNYFVFDQAVIKNIILTIKNCYLKNNKTTIKSFLSAFNFVENNFSKFQIEQKKFLDLKASRFETKPIYGLLNLKDKICKNSVSLENICLIAYGARLNHKTKDIGKENFVSKIFRKGYKPFLEGKNIERYYHSQFGWLDYQPTQHYNSMFSELFESEKLVFINVVKDRLRFAYDNEKYYNSHTVINAVRICDLAGAKHISAVKAVKKFGMQFSKNYAIKFLLGLLNSNLINWYFYNFQSEQLHFYPNDAKTLPIKEIDFSNKQEKQSHDQIIVHVEQLLQLNKDLQTASLETKKEQIKSKIEYNEDKINALVYALYNLTDEEIKLIENLTG